MAIIDMKKVVLVAHGGRQNKILKALHKSGMVEVVRSGNLENAAAKHDEAHRDDINKKLARLESVFDFMRAEKKDAQKQVKLTKKDEAPFAYEPVKNPLFVAQKKVSFEEFDGIAGIEEELFSSVEDLERIMSLYADIKSNIFKLENSIEHMEVFAPVDSAPSQIKGTKHTAAFIGTIPAENMEAFKAEYVKLEYAHAEFFAGEKLIPFVAFVLKDEEKDFQKILNDNDFARLNIETDKTPAKFIADALEEIELYEAEKLVLLRRSVAKEPVLNDLKLLYDYYIVEKAKQEAADGFACTKSAFVLEAWYAVPEEEKLKKLLDGLCDEMYYEFRKPLEEENPPTLIINSKIVAPYQAVTNMYSAPSKIDIDPNPFVSIFYFIFFGMMMGDAGYGILMAIGGFLVYKLSKPAPGKGKIPLVVAMGGVSTFIWGVIFGNWFGITLAEGSFLKKLQLLDTLNGNGPLIMLVLCFAFGLIHMITGMIIHAYDLIKNHKDVLGAFKEVFSWLFIFIGIGLLAVGMMIKDAPAVVSILSYVFLGLGAGIILLLSSNSKNPLKRLIGGLGKMYDGVNILSDLLSYSRLFGLGLSSAVIAMVVNKIAMVLVDLLTFGGFSGIGWVAAIIVILIGHVFNIGINTLGTYIHDCRLQYIEFFGKFYTGGGQQFVPLGSKTKYTYIEK